MLFPRQKFLITAQFLVAFFSLFLLSAPALSMKAKLSVISAPELHKNAKGELICTLSLLAGGPPVELTIKNNSSAITALNITAYFEGTALEGNVTSTTCGSVAPGATCTLTFTPGNTTVPLTSFTIRGINTSSITAAMQITAKAVISVTAPVQQNRLVPVAGAPLNLTITNNVASESDAHGITVTDKASCDQLAVDASNCTTVAPGASCNLVLNSAFGYIPCTITISGTDTDNQPTALIAFTVNGALVFEKTSLTSGLAVSMGSETTSSWTSPTTAPIVTTANGAANTTIINNDASCSGNTAGCAAFFCRNQGANFFLPSKEQMISLCNMFCPSGLPCNFGSYVFGGYWTSTDNTFSGTGAPLMGFNDCLANGFGNKTGPAYVICAQSFS